MPAFIRAFQQRCGISPHRYVLETRLEHARGLVLKGKGSMTDVAFSCGFASLSHFSGAFKKRWGASPTEMRSRRI